MKQSLFVIGFLGFAQLGLAAPISCGSPNSVYSVLVASGQKTAKLEVNHAATQFGSLACEVPASALLNGPFLVCRSTAVADDGYQVVLATDNATAQTTASVGKIWKGGTRPLTKLNCAVALHH